MDDCCRWINGVGDGVTLTLTITAKDGATSTITLASPVIAAGPVPVVTPGNFTLPSNPPADTLIGAISISNSPTAINIVAGNEKNYFEVWAATSHLRTAEATFGPIPPDGIYNLSLNAENANGTGPSAPVTVTVGQPITLAPTNFSLRLPVTAGAVIGSAGHTGNPTSWAITAGNSSGFFAINNMGVITVTAAGVAGLAVTTYNLTIQATNGFGSVSAMWKVSTLNSPVGPPTDPYAAIDGSLNAPSGTAQYPDLFTNPNAVAGVTNPNAPYLVRPPWKVAGVDYRVGINTGVTLRNISTITAADAGTNFSYNGVDKLTINDPNIILDSWDFTNGNNGSGTCVQLVQNSGAANLTVTNCNLAVGTNQNPIFNQTAAVQATFQYCVLDAHGRTDTFNNVIFNLASSGGLTCMYCYVNRGSQDEFDYGVNNVIKYNLIDSPGSTGGHADWVQLGGGGATASIVVDFNTVVQQTSAGSQGFGLFPGTSGTFNSTLLECNYNTVVSYTSVAQPNYIWQAFFSGSVTGGGTIGTVGTISCQNNYVDPSGVVANNGAHGFIVSGTQGGATFNYSNNINMITGNPIAVNT
jgi:hypothetical protein